MTRQWGSAQVPAPAPVEAKQGRGVKGRTASGAVQESGNENSRPRITSPGRESSKVGSGGQPKAASQLIVALALRSLAPGDSMLWIASSGQPKAGVNGLRG